MSYKGDLNQSLFNTSFFHPAGGVLFRRSFNNHWSAKLGFAIGSVSADDAEADNGFQKYRNLSFKSSVLELTGQFEFNFFPYQIANDRSSLATPYLLVGLTVFKFNPKGLYRGDYVELQPLGTEGQGTVQFPEREKYNRVVAALTYGGGLKFRLSKRFGMTIELGVRQTFTDYLDDVSTTYPDKDVLLVQNGPIAVAMSDKSPAFLTNDNNNRQRGTASDSDYYMFGGVSLNWTLSKKYADNCKPFRGKMK